MKIRTAFIIILALVILYLFGAYSLRILPAYYCGDAMGPEGVIEICHWGLPRIY
jgi:hypothetical protein